MATSIPPLITYLALDTDYDPVFDPAQSLVNGEAVAQAVLTRLKLFYGEWWEDLTDGLPVFQVILGQLATAQGQAAMSSAIRARIEGTPYVSAVNDITFNFDDGQFSFTATFQTSFGAITVNYAPGTATSIGQ